METKSHKDIAGLHFGRDGAHFQVASCGVAQSIVAYTIWNEDLSQNINMHSKRLNNILIKDI
jgi:hypothetical protein